ncbi:DSBA oxidoreductase [Weizmannia acidilactici]|uniref:DSBA oxidoreductase n=1 Tax=Weizmannia acidilactici TaxID=2607726 RepID=A0A5J4JE65_9BACI|nr:DsbA family protein [Weizmannia acidilactici]GER66614.1 DSBA oxidoreductase [Weizmannia acidilactici]GER68885.1 DSBA oxidoreductase [Weizmannia acidilactici]GER73514.1 DSBA oxidoreductase [Weizmannia acidilactici]
MKVELWSDFSSRDCYLAFLRLGQALEQFGHQEKVQFEIRSSISILDGEKERSRHIMDSLRLLHFAQENGKQFEMARALFEVYAGHPAPNRGFLVEVLQKSGFDQAGMVQLLNSDAYMENMKQDESEANMLGIDSAPVIVINRKYAISGVRTVDIILQSLYQAWREETYVPALEKQA